MMWTSTVMWSKWKVQLKVDKSCIVDRVVVDWVENAPTDSRWLRCYRRLFILD